MTTRIALIVLVMTTLACSFGVPVATSPGTKPPVKLVMTTPTASMTPVMTADVTATSLHVRDLPGHDNLVLGYLYNADTVTLTGSCRSGWAQIEWQGATAWVRAKYLSDNKCKE
jgi:uncharacterized protein YgiM (DUF1202 family)